MHWLNYHHLLYFWTVAREGGVAAAAARLRLAHPTVSGQIRALEDTIGDKLFTRVGRKLQLTDTGRLVMRYADEIFTLGNELQEVLRDQPTGKPIRLDVGIADALPKLVVKELLAPALQLGQPVRLVCREGKADRLLAELATQGLDLVLADAPAPSAARIFHHLLGECGLTFFAAGRLATQLKAGFPRSLDGAPMLLPLAGTTLRRSLEQWFDRDKIVPRNVGEFEDVALLHTFGTDGSATFVAPTVIEEEVARQYRVKVVGRTDQVRERYYALSPERRLKNPAVVAICERARSELFR
ncbi:MAG: transcriptional activator NhaR [Deltaproteobacteria bacterium]|nr:transcriptional activator NhaR [Deltaproteobacteria bacterium]